MNMGIMFDVSNLPKQLTQSRRKQQLRNELIKKAKKSNKTSETLGMVLQTGLGAVSGGLLGYLLGDRIGSRAAGTALGASYGTLLSVLPQGIGYLKGMTNPDGRTSKEQIAYESSSKEKLLNYLIPGRAGYNRGLTEATLNDLMETKNS